MDARFCPRCASALEPRPDGGKARPTCPACGFVAYRNPLPVALVLARDDAGRLLLIRRANEPLRGFWSPPAGYVEIDESVEDAAVRETREETGLSVSVRGLRGVYSSPSVGILIVAYDARVAAGIPTPGDDVEEAALFAQDELPPQPPAHSGSALDAWFLSVIRELTAGAGADVAGSDGAQRERIRRLEVRLATLQQEVDAARGEMASADVDRATLAEIAALTRELRELRGR